MLKRGFSMAFIVLAISILGFASFGTVVKKMYSDTEIGDGITIEQPGVKAVKSTLADNLTISGTITTPTGINVDMTLVRLDGKQAVDTASGLTSLTAPKFLLEKDLNSEREKTILKKFTNAYEERVKAGLEYEKAQKAYDKAVEEKKAATKIKELKDALDKTMTSLKSAVDTYKEASDDYIDMTTVVVFSDVSIGNSKLPGFSKVVKDIQPGYYKLTFTRKDSNKVVKTLEFEVILASELIKDIESGKK